ncbi:MAG: hypothetical protein GY791_20680 [Alphaproteobacteria bacterium]|nr:hypothetical protein [Alphaproteobacteria bacterium]
MTDTLIISAADSGYFALLKGLILSIREKNEGRTTPIKIMNLGLTPDQVDWLAGQNAGVVETDWAIDFPGRDECPNTFKAQVNRPFLPQLFPEHESLIWLDADIWVQTWDAIKWFTMAAKQDFLAVVPEIDRSYRYTFHKPNESGFIPSLYAGVFGEEERQTGLLPTLNVGAFSMSAASDFWPLWQQTLDRVLSKSTTFLAEQAAFNFAVYKYRPTRYQFLPTIYNWMCNQSTPRFRKEMFVEPSPPFQPISMMHLSFKAKLDETIEVQCDDGPRKMSLRYRQGQY